MILTAARNCRRWSHIEIILDTVMFEKILSLNVLELLVTLLGCSIRGRK